MPESTMLHLRSKRGFTLLEIMIVLIIVAFMAFIGMNMVSGTFRAKARELSWRISSTVRYLYNSAVTENKTIRLALDFESNSYWAEATHERFLLEKGEDKEKTEKRKAEQEKEEPKKEGSAEITPEDPAGKDEGEGEEKISYLEPVEATFGSVEAPFLETRSLPSGLYLKDVWTEHDDGAVGGGRAYIYFYPNGTSESAVINFRDEADERHISIKINPFNGEVDISPEYRSIEKK
jgi:prepilin-type N-terminal cleavage/methylation domain-containing protein